MEDTIISKVMEAILSCCAGMDVHSATVAVCVRRIDDRGAIHAEVRTFGTIARDLTSAANRIHKVLGDINIKPGLVATDILGVSGRKMILALIDGETDTVKMADMARGRLRDKIPQLEQVLVGKVTDHYRFLLKALMDQLIYLQTQIERFNRRSEEAVRPFEVSVQPGREILSSGGLTGRARELDRLALRAIAGMWRSRQTISRPH